MSDYEKAEEFLRNEVSASTGESIDAIISSSVLVVLGRVVDSADLVMLLIWEL